MRERRTHLSREPGRKLINLNGYVVLANDNLPKAILPKGWITLGLWLTSAVMLGMMGYSAIQQLTL